MLLLLEARREARKAFLAFSGNEGGPELAQNESSRSDSEECTEKYKDGICASQNTPVSNLTQRPLLISYFFLYIWKMVVFLVLLTTLVSFYTSQKTISSLTPLF